MKALLKQSLLLSVLFTLTSAFSVKQQLQSQINQLDHMELAQQSTYSPNILIPLYIWPDSDGTNCIQPFYKKIVETLPLRTSVILNPRDGPNYKTHPDAAWLLISYKACIKYLKDNGVKVYGYVHTKVGWSTGYITGYRPTADIKADITLWKTDYPPIDGIFVDEVSNLWPNATIGDSVTKYTQTYGEIMTHITNTQSTWKIVLNPGGPYNPTLASGKSHVMGVLYEKGAQFWNPPTSCAAIQFNNTNGLYGSFLRGPWCEFIPNGSGIEPIYNAVNAGTLTQAQNAALIYGVAENKATVSNIIKQGLDAKVGVFFLTNQNEANAWSSAPSLTFWQYFTEAIQGNYN